VGETKGIDPEEWRRSMTAQQLVELKAAVKNRLGVLQKLRKKLGDEGCKTSDVNRRIALLDSTDEDAEPFASGIGLSQILDDQIDAFATGWEAAEATREPADDREDDEDG